MHVIGRVRVIQAFVYEGNNPVDRFVTRIPFAVGHEFDYFDRDDKVIRILNAGEVEWANVPAAYFTEVPMKTCDRCHQPTEGAGRWIVDTNGNTLRLCEDCLDEFNDRP